MRKIREKGGREEGREGKGKRNGGDRILLGWKSQEVKFLTQ